MNTDGLKAGALEGVIEAVKLVPGIGVLVESVRAYHDTIEQQQREAFVNLLAARIEKIENHSEWFTTEEGVKFVQKIVATALNAEYTDKLEFLANALSNGPILGNNDATRLKFVDFIRSLSKPALDALVGFAKHSSIGTEVKAGNVARIMDWKPELADACIRELHSLGVYSSITSWRLDRYADRYEPGAYFSDGRCAPTELTEEFVQFVSSP
jgi:hypothetical protein